MLASILVLTVCLFGLIRYVIHPIWWSPLAKVPNAHWLAPITPLWILWRRWKGAEVSTIWEAIQAKGNFVRLGPYELLVNSYPGGVRTVYSGGHEKPNWYSFYQNHGKRNIFTSLGRDHVTRRRRIANLYSKTFIHQSSHVRQILYTVLIERYLPILFRAVQDGNPCGVLGLNMAYGLDCVSSLMLGICQGTDFVRNQDARDTWLGEYLKSHPNDYMFWLLEVPKLTTFLAKLRINVVPQWVSKAHHNLEEWAWNLVDCTEAALTATAEGAKGDGNDPLVYIQLRRALTEERRKSGKDDNDATSYMQQRDELASEILDQLVATRDVFGITFTYILWEISKHADWQRELQRELRSVEKPLLLSELASQSDLIAPRELESLQTLNIIIKESMRLRTTVPVPNPRLTPIGKTTIGPYKNIPGRVRTNSYAWCLHHDTSVYTDPFQWKPERWIRSDGQRESMDSQFWAFGSGSRICLGMALAMEMIRYGIACIYTNLTTTIVDDDAFSTEGKFITGLPGEDLVLKLEPLDPLMA